VIITPPSFKTILATQLKRLQDTTHSRPSAQARSPDSQPCQPSLQMSYFCPVYRALNLAARNGVPAWTYLFPHTPSCVWFQNLFPPQALPFLRATHTAEVAFVFGNLGNFPLPNGTRNFNPTEQAIRQAMVEAWTSLAARGDPSSYGMEWPLWNATQSLSINIVNGTSVGFVNYTTCEFWDVIDNILKFTTGNSTSNITTSGTAPTSSYIQSGASEIPSLSALYFTVALLVLLGGMMGLL
jgi:hypothetical protein